MNVVSILGVPRLSSIACTRWVYAGTGGITQVNTSGIAAKFSLAKVPKLQKNGPKNVKVGCGTDRRGNC